MKIAKFEERIKALRNDKGLSHSQLAGIFNKTEGAIRAWETGRTKPDADTLIKLADYFETTTDYLLGRADNRFQPEKVGSTKLENGVLTQCTNALNEFFIKYNEYQKTNDAMKLDKALYIAIVGGINSLLDANRVLIERLSSIHECKTMQDVEEILKDYLNEIPDIHFGGDKIPNGRQRGGYTDFEIELMIRDEFEKKVPGYKEYRRDFLIDWAKRINEDKEEEG